MVISRPPGCYRQLPVSDHANITSKTHKVYDHACAETPAAKMESHGDQGQQWKAEQEGPSLGLPLQMGLHPHSVPQERPSEVRHADNPMHLLHLVKNRKCRMRAP